MTVKHHFSGVANGRNFNTGGVEASKGTDKALAMTNQAQGDAATDDTINDEDFDGALLVGTLAAGTADSPVAALDPCEDAKYNDPRSGLHKPDSCFRAVSAGDTKDGTDYYGGYSIELTAKDSGVSWGKVVWSSDTNPFKDLKCESMTFMATDVAEVDVCDLFEDDVDAAMAAGWGGSRGTSVSFMGSAPAIGGSAAVASAALDTSANRPNLETLLITAPASPEKGFRFAALYHSDNDGSTKDPAAHDLYAAERTPLQVDLLDSDGDPIYGDFGKVDFTKADGTDDGTLQDLGQDGSAESAPGGESKCSHSDGEGCDGMLETMITVKFDAGLALGCSTTRDVMITCEWDSNGEMGAYRADDHTGVPATEGAALPTGGNEVVVLGDDGADPATSSTFAGFRTSPSSGRAPGDISAFVSCKVSGS